MFYYYPSEFRLLSFYAFRRATFSKFLADGIMISVVITMLAFVSNMIMSGLLYSALSSVFVTYKGCILYVLHVACVYYR